MKPQVLTQVPYKLASGDLTCHSPATRDSLQRLRYSNETTGLWLMLSPLPEATPLKSHGIHPNPDVTSSAKISPDCPTGSLSNPESPLEFSSFVLFFKNHTSWDSFVSETTVPGFSR